MIHDAGAKQIAPVLKALHAIVMLVETFAYLFESLDIVVGFPVFEHDRIRLRYIPPNLPHGGAAGVAPKPHEAVFCGHGGGIVGGKEEEGGYEGGEEGELHFRCFCGELALISMIRI
jgi:hypothetical protein